MKFNKLYRQLTEAVVKDKTLEANGKSCTVALEETSGGKFKVKVTGSLSGSSEYDSKSEADKRYNSLETYSDVEKWLGKSTKGVRRHVRHIGGGGIPRPPKPPTEPPTEPTEPPTDGDGSEPSPAPVSASTKKESKKKSK